MDGHHAGLHAEADDEQDRRRPTDDLVAVTGWQRFERTGTPERERQEDAAHQSEAAHHGHPEVLAGGLLRLIRLRVYHQQERHEPQRLEEQVQGHQVAGQHHSQIGREDHERGGVIAVMLLLMMQVVQRVDGGGQPHEGREDGEQHRERVHGERQFAEKRRYHGLDAVVLGHERYQSCRSKQRERHHDYHVCAPHARPALSQRSDERCGSQRQEHDCRR